MKKAILLVHGRSWKPVKNQLFELWRDALRAGIARDHPEALSAFDETGIRMVYYGDLTNEVLSKKNGDAPVPAISGRRKSLERLMRYQASEFDERNYKNIPGQTRYHDALARAVGSLAMSLRLGRPLIETYAPDIKEYWNQDSEFGTEVRWRMLDGVKHSLDEDVPLLVISHSLGAVITYDILWKLSRTAEYRDNYGHKKIDFWITLGAPLGDMAIRKNLKGFHAFGPRRYPSNIRQWLNVWAVDDYLCHEQELAEDYKDMIEYGLVESIEDAAIYNLSVRNGESNPHCSVGYLVHPVVSRAVARWLA